MRVPNHPHTTWPVKRGKWLLEQLLCTPKAPPQPGVEVHPCPPSPDASGREQLAEHREPDVCRLRNLIDLLGLGLELYEPVGAVRALDGGKPAVTGARDMVALLSERDDFTALHRQADGELRPGSRHEGR